MQYSTNANLLSKTFRNRHNILFEMFKSDCQQMNAPNRPINATTPNLTFQKCEEGAGQLWRIY